MDFRVLDTLVTLVIVLQEVSMGEDNRRLFDAQFVEHVSPPKSGRVEYRDIKVPGFVLRVSANGHKSWYVTYRVKGDRTIKRKALGRYPEVTLSKARMAALAVKMKAAEGIDDQPEEPKQQPAGLTFEDLASDFIERYAKVKKRSWLDNQHDLDRHILPHWRSRPVGEIRRRDVIEVIDRVAHGIKGDDGRWTRNPAPISANRVLSLLHKIFVWANSRDILDGNPCAGVAKPSEEHQRDRVLTPDEIRAVWIAVDALADPLPTILRLCLATGQRLGEVRGMEWTEVKDALWTIPAARHKGKRDHLVPLSPMAVDLIASMPSSGKWVFPAQDGKKALGHTGKMYTRLRQAAGIDDIVVHDFRRTAATGMAEIGIAEYVISKVLGHSASTDVKIASVTSRYNRHLYLEEKRDALDRWSVRLAEILAEKPSGQTNATPAPAKRAASSTASAGTRSPGKTSTAKRPPGR